MQDVGVAEAVSGFGADVKKKLANPAATGQPEDQLRGLVGIPITDDADAGGTGL